MLRKSDLELTNAARAEAVFKPVAPKVKELDEQALKKKAFDENRERLKAERIAREDN